MRVRHGGRFVLRVRLFRLQYDVSMPVLAFDTVEFSIRLLSAAGLGGIIGLERQLSRHLAGLQTNTLVASGAAMFIFISEAAMGPSDTRIAGQIVTGIGFLGSGIIMRDGLNVRGLNTAATIWCTAAIGCLCGAGNLRAAVLASGTVLGINTIVRPLAKKLSGRGEPMADFCYRISADVSSQEEAVVRAELLHLLMLGKLSLRSVRTEELPSQQIRMEADVFSNEKADATLAQIASGFATRQGVSALRWEACH